VAAGERPDRYDRRVTDEHVFQHTGIATYIWILDNTKHPDRKGLVQLIDGTSFWTKMRKNLGAKNRELGEDDRAKVVQLYADFIDADPDYSKVLRNDEFGYWTITVERPLLDQSGNPVLDRNRRPKPDTKKRDVENVPFTYGGSLLGAAGNVDVIQMYFDAEVKPHAIDAWIDRAKTKTGYEIPSPATSTSMPHPALLPRSTPTWKSRSPRSSICCARWSSDGIALGHLAGRMAGWTG
jgi:type I restriction enzyme M protein